MYVKSISEFRCFLSLFFHFSVWNMKYSFIYYKYLVHFLCAFLLILIIIIGFTVQWIMIPSQKQLLLHQYKIFQWMKFSKREKITYPADKNNEPWQRIIEVFHYLAFIWLGLESGEQLNTHTILFSPAFSKYSIPIWVNYTKRCGNRWG